MPKKNKRKKKQSLKQTVERLAVIAEKHLASMPEEEQEERVAALSRRTLTPGRGISAIPSKTEYRPDSRVLARGRE
jgi:hypothetical protein